MATRISPNKIAALAKIARANGISKLAIPGLRLEFLPVEPLPKKDEPVVKDHRQDFKNYIAEQLGGVSPDDVQIPGEWTMTPESLREEVERYKQKKERP